MSGAHALDGGMDHFLQEHIDDGFSQKKKNIYIIYEPRLDQIRITLILIKSTYE